MKQLSVLVFSLILVSKACFAEATLSHYEKALALFNEQKFADAEIVVKNSIQENPNYLPARLLLGKTLLQQGKIDAAEKELTLSLNLRADSDIVVLPLIDTKLLLNKPQEALSLFEQYQHLSRDAQYYLLKGNTYKALDQLASAEESYQSALAINSKDIKTLTALSDLFYQQRDVKKALQYVDQALLVSPLYTPALLLRAELFKETKKFQDAANQYQSILASEPNNKQALFGQASVLLAQNQLDDALLLSTKLRQLAPNDPYAKLLHSSLLTLQGDSTQGKQILADIQQQILGLSDQQRSEENVLLLSSSVDFLNGNFQQARIQLQRYLQNYGEHLIVRRHLATIALRENDVKQAEFHINKALDINEDDVEVQLLASAIFKQTLSPHDYLSFVTNTYQEHKENQLVKEQYIAALIEAGEYQQAQALLSQQSDSLATKTLLGFVLLQQADYQQATKISQDLLNRYPNKVEVLQLAGELSLKIGQREDAIALFKQAIVLDEKFRPALLALAGISLNEQKLKQAESYYQHILNFYPEDADVLQLYADLAITQQQHQLAIKLLMSLPESIRDNKQTTGALLSLYLTTNQLDLAQGAAEQLKKIDPFNQEYLLARSQLEKQQGDINKAQKTLKVLFGLVYDEIIKLEHVASLQLDLGDDEAAAKTIERASDLSGHANDYLNARLALIREDYAAVDQAVSEALQGDDKNQAWLELQIYSLMAQQQQAAALPLLESLYSDSASRKYLQLLAQLYAALNKKDELQQLLSIWLTNNPQDTWATAQLSSLFEKSGNITAAIKILESYPQVNSQPLFLNNLAALYQSTDLKKASRYAYKAHQLLPNFAPINDTLGWTLVLQNKPEQGLSYLREAISRDSTKATYHYHLAITLEKLGRLDEAKQTALNAQRLNAEHHLLSAIQHLLTVK